MLRIILGFLFIFLFKTVSGKNLSYSSENLVIKQVKEHVYVHISYLQTESFGKVDCNGMIVVQGNQAMIFDTPATQEASEELLAFLTGQLKLKIKAVVATHFHEDCVGGLSVFHKYGIPSYSGTKTRDLVDAELFDVPQHVFEHEIQLKLKGKKIMLYYPGEGHTRDNTVAYFPAEKAMFGGCLVKTKGATKGYLGDSNEKEWPETIRNLYRKFPDAEVVIPGHGELGSSALLDYTIDLFSK
jgi:metallo-beta-lactamase class B